MENEFRREVFVLKPTSKEEKEKTKLRVAAYCRVSTDSEDQVHSFIAQVKYYTDFIRNRRNRGEVDQYYVSNSHEAVLDKDTFAAVQEMLKKNLEKEALKAAPKKYFFSGKIFCVDCGWAYKRRVQNDIVYWVCSKSGIAGQHCCTHPLSEEVIGKTFCNMYNKLRQHENELLKSTLTRLVELKAAVTQSRSEVIDIDEKLVKIADRLAFYMEQYEAGVIDDGIYNDRTIADRKKISELRTRRNKLLTDDEDEQCIDELRQLILYLES